MSNKPLQVFIGYDHRQAISLNVLQYSIYKNASKPVSITPIVLPTTPLKRAGLTPFTFSRFLVPYLCDYEGWALFLDIDMLVLGDIAELFALKDEKYAVQVVKNKKQFEWASMMLFNCSKNTILTPEYIETAQGLHGISWLEPELVGDLPSEWNHLCGYDAPRVDAKLVHYTQGVPVFPETNDSEYSKEWHEYHKYMNSATNWVELMGNSVHAARLPDGTLVPKYKAASNAA